MQNRDPVSFYFEHTSDVNPHPPNRKEEKETHHHRFRKESVRPESVPELIKLRDVLAALTHCSVEYAYFLF